VTYTGTEQERARAREQMRKWRATNPETSRARVKAYRAAHPEETRARGRAYRAKNAIRISQQRRAHYQANKDRLLLDCRQRRQKNPTKNVEQVKRWREKNPDKLRAQSKRRRAVKAGAPINDFTAAQWQTMKEHYGHRCVYCGKKQQRLSQDHIIPLIQGGAHTQSNIVPACKSCNSKKGTGGPLIPVQPLLL